MKWIGFTVLCLFAAMSARADVFRVGVEGDYPTIAAGVVAAAATAGAEHDVRIQSGYYTGSVNLNLAVARNLVISGCWNSTFDDHCVDPTQTIWSADPGVQLLKLALIGGGEVNLAALTLTGGYSPIEAGGIEAHVAVGGRLGLYDLVVTGHKTESTVATGINARLTGTGSLTIDHVTVSGNLSLGGSGGSKQGVGMRLSLLNTATAFLSHLQIHENGDTAASTATVGGGLLADVGDNGYLALIDSRIEDHDWLAPAIAGSGLFINANQNALVRIQRIRLLNNIVAEGAAGTRSQAEFSVNGAARLDIGDSVIALSNCAGIVIHAYTSNSVHVQNSTIAHLVGYGIIMNGSGGARSFSNSIVHDTFVPGFGVALDGSVVRTNDLGDDIDGQDPQFRGLADFRLTAGSPAIDSGTAIPPSGALSTVDVDQLQRLQGVTVDIGAHESLPDVVFSNGFEG